MQSNGSNKTRLTYNVGFETTTPSWSSNGSRIAFDCANDICSINADGTNFAQLTTDPVTASGAVFSPVDDRIAFETGRFGRFEVAIMDGSGAVTRVAPGLMASQYSWSPDGEIGRQYRPPSRGSSAEIHFPFAAAGTGIRIPRKWPGPTTPRGSCAGRSVPDESRAGGQRSLSGYPRQFRRYCDLALQPRPRDG